MKKVYIIIVVYLFLVIFLNVKLYSQITPVGSGSYINNFPGVDEAGRNTYPSGTPYTTGVAATKPVPTNDWWSSKVKEAHVNNLFNYPLALATKNSGLLISYIPAPSGANGSSQPMDDASPIIVGVTGLNVSAANVSDFSDFIVSMNWTNSDHNFNATIGIGMPFIYFTKKSTDVAQVIINEGSITVSNEIIIVENAHNGADFVIYAPEGSVWENSGNVYTSTLNNKNYWSIGHLPPSATSLVSVAEEYKKYAYVFPVNTITEWNYNENTAIVRTDFKVTCDVKEGNDTNILLGLLPHQWGNLASDSPKPEGYNYPSIRGEIKSLAGNSFSVINKFRGILPTLPYLNNYSIGFSPSKLNDKIQLIENDGLTTWTDSYNEGQVMNRLIQTARIADLSGNYPARDKMLTTIKSRLEDWLTAENNEVAFLFYYNSTWSTLIGYPAGHGQDGNINDHHFHWGYFIHAAAFLEQYQPGWADGWGEMINHLIRDAASFDREDDMFPFLRNFSPYAGHCWANGFATFPFGNDQESTSESMQFNSSLIHWGTITGNKDIRDLGIYLYTTEQSAIEEYWMDIHDRIFKPEYNYSIVSRVWGNGYDNQTFWTSDIAAAYGIEMYPIHGGSLYLGHNLEYAQKLWNEITENTGILDNAANANLWHDIMWEYLAFFDAETAIEMYNSYPERDLKFGVSDAQTYHWLHAMNALGNIDTSITANYPIAVAFNKDGEITYTAHNYSDEVISVAFSDGYTLTVQANKMATSKDIGVSGKLSSSFLQAFANGSVELSVSIENGAATKVEFFDGENKLGEKSQAPFNFKAENLNSGKHHFYARIFENENFNVSNIVSVFVGQQLAYSGTPSVIPGSIQAGLYDKFEGGNGQGVSYNDVSIVNEGGFRPQEYVDASVDNTEGEVVGWIASGEWLEYTVDVLDAGFYSMEFRYACGNSIGGGPFYLELDGKVISDSIYVSYTGDWGAWSSKTISNIPFSQGEHVLRLVFSNGELNLGKFDFSFESNLTYNQPIANAGDNILVILPESTVILDASNSIDPEGENLKFTWAQLYGPSIVNFSDINSVTPELSSLEEGIYAIQLEVENSLYSDTDELFVIVSSTDIIAPYISLNSPADMSDFIVGSNIILSAEASDMDGVIEKVEFFVNETKVGTVTTIPYRIEWTPMEIGVFEVKAIATDNDGNTTASAHKTVIINEAPPCDGEAFNGEYSYLFSDDDDNPTLTFIPSQAGVGSPTCILYYGTNPNEPFPGYNVTPNTPFTINADEGSTVYFYYTYSYPNQGEHNTADHMDSYVVGSCLSTTIKTNHLYENIISYYPNPVENNLQIKLSQERNIINVFTISGVLINSFEVNTSEYELNMINLNKGLYLIEVKNNNYSNFFKVIKN